MELSVPAKVIEVEVVAQKATDYWPWDDGHGDPFWQFGSTPKPYRWEISMNVSTQSHSSHLTREANLFNGMDIHVGDWIADSVNGIALKIIGVNSKTETSCTCIVEDVLRYNTYRSKAGQGVGIFTIPTNAVIFQVNEDGYPIVDPVPATGIGSNFVANLFSRFNNWNEGRNYILEKENHGFVEGDIIAADPISHTFTIADSTHRNLIGRVAIPGPGPNYFIVNPLNTIYEFDYLDGDVGDMLYVGEDGRLTVTTTDAPLYIKLRNSTSTNVTGTVVDGTTAPGNIIIINGVEVTIGGTGTVDDAINSINATTDQHGITASYVLAPTIVGITAPWVYGEPGAFITTSPQIEINGQAITLTTTTQGSTEYPSYTGLALEQDLVTDINNANIANVVAEVTGTNDFVIKETTGGQLTITNISNDDNGNPIFSSLSSEASCFGIVEGTYGPSSGKYLHLVAPDAREITLVNKSSNLGNVLNDFGIYSVENGVKAAAIYVENGIRKGDTYVVSNIAARDNLTVLVGDMALVQDTGEGEWGLYIWSGSEWTMVSNQDSSTTDARTVSITLDYTTASGSYVIHRVSPGSRISSVLIDVKQPFDIIPTLTVGDSIDNERLMNDNLHDLSTIGAYQSTSTYQYPGPNETEILAFFQNNGSTTGQVVITITYS